jgi:lipopolysaccharide export system protein LptA
MVAESQIMPAVQLQTQQQLQVSASNFSTSSVMITINILNSTGNVVSTKTVTVAADKTYVLRYTNGNSIATYSAVVEASIANSVAPDLQVLGSNGEVIAISLPYLETNLAAVQYTPGVRLVPGQSAKATVTNASTGAAQFSLVVMDVNGNTVLTESGDINPGQTLTYQYDNMGNSNNVYRAVVSAPANTVVSSIMTFDVKTGGLLVLDEGGGF